MTKKIMITLTAALMLIGGPLIGCGADESSLTAEDYILDSETCETSRGIALGSTPDEFFDAYGDCDCFISVDGGDYQTLSKEEIPSGSFVKTLIPAFFVDGEPIDPAAFCKEYDIEESGMIDYLTSADFLNAHTAEYRYLTFTWENGAVADIQSAYMNYNEEGAN